ncbi:MAG: L-threonylcarbamoyladenylate synthase [Microthrixaceae bacterium]
MVTNPTEATTANLRVERAAQVVQVAADAPEPKAISQAAEILRQGGLVAFPTETVYGLGACASNADAVSDVFSAKGRPLTDPLILHIAHLEQMPEIVADFPRTAQLLAESFWPGPLTLVLPRNEKVLDLVTAQAPTVAVRIPSHPVALAMLTEAGFAVAAPSANRFGRISPSTAEHVQNELGNTFDLLLDAGPTTLGVESTVVDLCGERPKLLRPGGVTLEQLTEVLGLIDYAAQEVSSEAVAASAPGLFLRHYSPRTPLLLIEGSDALVKQLLAALGENDVKALPVEISQEPVLAAKELYSRLREADEWDAQILLVRPTEASGLGLAVNDRLFRAAQGRILKEFSAESVRFATTIAGSSGRLIAD